MFCDHLVHQRPCNNKQNNNTYSTLSVYVPFLMVRARFSLVPPAAGGTSTASVPFPAAAFAPAGVAASSTPAAGGGAPLPLPQGGSGCFG
jgi:hypothetical protein